MGETQPFQWALDAWGRIDRPMVGD